MLDKLFGKKIKDKRIIYGLDYRANGLYDLYSINQFIRYGDSSWVSKKKKIILKSIKDKSIARKHLKNINNS